MHSKLSKLLDISLVVFFVVLLFNIKYISSVIGDVLYKGFEKAPIIIIAFVLLIGIFIVQQGIRNKLNDEQILGNTRILRGAVMIVICALLLFNI